MSDVFSQLLIHIVFSTKHRAALIGPDMEPRLHAYLTRLINEKFGQLLAINGVEDHLHILVDIKTSVRLADLVRELKSKSTRWVRRHFPQHRLFAWQIGYACFSVSKTRKRRVCRYIARQKDHHRAGNFGAELRRMTFE